MAEAVMYGVLGVVLYKWPQASHLGMPQAQLTSLPSFTRSVS